MNSIQVVNAQSGSPPKTDKRTKLNQVFAAAVSSSTNVEKFRSTSLSAAAQGCALSPTSNWMQFNTSLAPEIAWKDQENVQSVEPRAVKVQTITRNANFLNHVGILFPLFINNVKAS